MKKLIDDIFNDKIFIEKLREEIKYKESLKKECKNIKPSNVFFNYGWIIMIGWFSVILFLVDFADRTGKWWFHLIAMFFVVTSIGALIIKFIEDKSKYKKKKL